MPENPELAVTTAASDLDRLLAAQSLVRSYCDWHIAPSRADEVFTTTGDGGRLLVLPSLWVTDVSAVTVAGVALAEGTGYLWERWGGVARVGARWTRGAAISVTFTHGHPEVPPDVAAVVRGIATRSSGNPSGVTREQAGPFSVSYAAALSEDDMTRLGPYRIQHVG